MRVLCGVAAFLLACGPAKVGLEDSADSDPADSGDSGSTDSADSGDSGDSGDPGDSGDTGDSAETGDTGEPITLTGTAAVAANEANPFSAVVTITVDHDASVWVEYLDGARLRFTPAVEAEAGVPTEVLVLGLRADRDFTLTPKAAVGEAASWEGEDLAFRTEPLERNWPTCTSTFHVDEAEFDEDEVVCTNVSGGNYAYRYACFDRWGEPVLSIRTDANDGLLSMRPLRDGSWASTSISQSKLLLFDAKGETSAQYTPAWFADKTRFTHMYVDSHEVYEIPSGEWAGLLAIITNSYEYLSNGDYKLGNGLVVFDPVLEEVVYDYSLMGDLDDGESLDPKVPYDRAGYGDYSQDWTHANAVLLGADADGREFFLWSLKSQDWILKLYPDTDELEWALGFEGDFTLVDDIDAARPVERPDVDWAFHQHGMVFLERGGPRNRLLMFDNGYPRSDDTGYRWDLGYSRIVEMRYDESTGLADIPFEYGTPRGPDNFLSSTCGNTELLPSDDAVIALDGEGKRMFEVGYPSGERRWELSCTSVEWCAYRVHYAPDIYSLTWDER